MSRTTRTIQPEGRDQHLRSLSAREIEKIARDSRDALDAAWPHRHRSLRAKIVTRSNVRMLRDLSLLS